MLLQANVNCFRSHIYLNNRSKQFQTKIWRNYNFFKFLTQLYTHTSFFPPYFSCPFCRFSILVFLTLSFIFSTPSWKWRPALFVLELRHLLLWSYGHSDQVTTLKIALMVSCKIRWCYGSTDNYLCNNLNITISHLNMKIIVP